jgi:hypothetical protein
LLERPSDFAKLFVVEHSDITVDGFSNGSGVYWSNLDNCASAIASLDTVYRICSAIFEAIKVTANITSKFLGSNSEVILDHSHSHSMGLNSLFEIFFGDVKDFLDSLMKFILGVIKLGFKSLFLFLSVIFNVWLTSSCFNTTVSVLIVCEIKVTIPVNVTLKQPVGDADGSCFLVAVFWRTDGIKETNLDFSPILEGLSKGDVLSSLVGSKCVYKG